MDDPEDPKQGLKEAYARLADELDFENLLVAHGEPIAGARAGACASSRPRYEARRGLVVDSPRILARDTLRAAPPEARAASSARGGPRTPGCAGYRAVRRAREYHLGRVRASSNPT